MKKTILQAVAFSVVVHLFIIGFQIMRGYFQTKNYTPSISEPYENVHMLQNEVAFGVVYNANGILLLVFTFLAGVICYIVGKLIWMKSFAK